MDCIAHYRVGHDTKRDCNEYKGIDDTIYNDMHCSAISKFMLIHLCAFPLVFWRPNGVNINKSESSNNENSRKPKKLMIVLLLQ